jgi:hypothetical protein
VQVGSVTLPHLRLTSEADIVLVRFKWERWECMHCKVSGTLDSFAHVLLNDSYRKYRPLKGESGQQQSFCIFLPRCHTHNVTLIQIQVCQMLVYFIQLLANLSTLGITLARITSFRLGDSNISGQCYSYQLPGSR